MSPTLFQMALYASLALCAAGPRCGASSAWFRIRIGPDARDVTPSQRVAAALRGAASTLVSRRVFRRPRRLLPRRAAAAPAVREREAALARAPAHRRRFHAAAADARAGAARDREAVPGLPAHARSLSVPAQPLRGDGARRRGAAPRRSPASRSGPRARRAAPSPRRSWRCSGSSSPADSCSRRTRSPHRARSTAWPSSSSARADRGEARAAARALGQRVRRGVRRPGGSRSIRRWSSRAAICTARPARPATRGPRPPSSPIRSPG